MEGAKIAHQKGVTMTGFMTYCGAYVTTRKAALPAKAICRKYDFKWIIEADARKYAQQAPRRWKPGEGSVQG